MSQLVQNSVLQNDLGCRQGVLWVSLFQSCSSLWVGGVTKMMQAQLRVCISCFILMSLT